MTDYFRVGNRTLTASEMGFMTPKQIEEIKTQAEVAKQKRLENLRKGLGVEPQKITLDVTPAGVAARKAAIAAEEARIAAETENIEVELGAEGSFLAEGEGLEVSVKKTKEQRAEEKRLKAEEKKQKAEATA